MATCIYWILDGRIAPPPPAAEAGTPVEERDLLQRTGFVKITAGEQGTTIRWSMFSRNWASLFFAAEWLQGCFGPYQLQYYSAGWFNERHDEPWAAADRIHLDSIAAAKVVESQAGGFRHRRDGLAYRLWMEDQAGRWRPAKRVAPAQNHLSRQLCTIHAARYQLGQASHAAFASAVAAGDFEVFKQTMEPMLAAYQGLYRRPLPLRILGRIRRIVKNLLGGKS